jgi:hypothetical protein
MYYGFLYIITNNITGKKYIGRKFYHTYRKRKKLKESNWRKYTGSCKPLNEDIKTLGKENFTFEIFKQYLTRGNVVYYECNYQHKFDVLTARDEEGERLWYNGNIGAIKFIPPEEHSSETIAKLQKPNTSKHNANIAAARKGIQFTEEHKSNISKSHQGKPALNRGAHYEAKERGDEFYTSRPCKYGHNGLRYTSTRQCVECHKMRNKK